MFSSSACLHLGGGGGRGGGRDSYNDRNSGYGGSGGYNSSYGGDYPSNMLLLIYELLVEMNDYWFFSSEFVFKNVRY